IAAVAGSKRVDIVMLHPRGRTSEVQRRQMTTVLAPNVHNVALDGTFDDCQDAVKAMFGDLEFRDRWNLSAVNSINWARVAAQIGYYAHAALALGAPDRAVSCCVP
ncbi:MAG: threonine synthase, partial [bacterium]